MKNIIKLIVISVLLISCNDDFLERYPLSAVVPENSFKTADDLKLYTNSFYNDLPGFDGIIGLDKLSDNVLYNGAPLEQSSELRLVPTDIGGGGWSWGDLRKINIFFKYYEQCSDEAAKKEYSGVAYFFRAYFYYNKLKRFGDVPWYDQVIGTEDSDLLLKPRDSRIFITTKVIEDLDKAIANLNSTKASDRVNIWTALALKSRVCLFEGTFRKYHGLAGADALLTLAYQAADRLMRDGPYSLYATGSVSTDYRDLFASDELKETEIILGRRYAGLVANSINYYFINPTQEDASLTKSIVDTYLTKTGTAFTSESGYATKTFAQETVNRDPRLSQSIRTPGYIRIGATTAILPDFSSAMSGYQISKYVSSASQDGNAAGFQDLPIIRYAEVLLNFAEAKAELGILTQADLDRSVKLLRDRVGMPALNLAAANASPDAVLSTTHSNVTGSNRGVILEIRRERRVELVMEGFRYDDLMRWKNGKLLEDKFKGMYFTGLGSFDLDGNTTIDIELYSGARPSGGPSQKIEIGGSSVFSLSNGASGNLMPFATRVKSFDESRDYLYPIPTGDILLNPNLVQNPKW